MYFFIFFKLCKFLKKIFLFIFCDIFLNKINKFNFIFISNFHFFSIFQYEKIFYYNFFNLNYNK